MADLFELTVPFFARKKTKRLIDVIAHLDEVVVFAGAGVTVDRTGLTWEALICYLLSKQGASDEEAEELVTAMGPLRAASIAVDRYHQRYGAKDWRLVLANELRTVLYESRDWLSGRLSGAIAEMWVEFAGAGKPFRILTTNYDEHVLLDIQEAAAVWKQQMEMGGPDPGLPEPEAYVDFLHGRVPANGKISNFPVVSERDYYEASGSSRDRLIEAFRDKDVLVIGASVSDAPLINALFETRDVAKQNHRRRIAMLPRQDLNAMGVDSRAVRVLEAHESRLSHLRMEGIFVDHYAQLAQLLAEVRVAATLEPSEYPKSSKRHGGRLDSWWDRWFKQITESGYESVQASHHQALGAALAAVRAELSDSDEDLKLELWLRWQPSTGSRRLRLWASSFARFADWRLSRDALISPDSKYAAVRAFCCGRVDYGEKSDQTERWKTFAAVPLEARGEVNLVVGTIVLASMTPAESSCLASSRRGHHAQALKTAADAGRVLIRTP